MIRAVTFDLWDTLVVDDSDEAERKRRGLLPKTAAREAVFVDSVLAIHPELPRAQIAAGWHQANAWFEAEWKGRHVTPHIAERVGRAFQALEISPPAQVGELVRQLAEMEVEIPPLASPGIHAALEALSTRYRLGVISDAIVSPGLSLRKILRHHHLLHYFEVLIFSDEVGAAKPDPHIFKVATEDLSVSPGELVHIGDRESNDIAGPRAFGSKSILYVGSVDRRGDKGTEADAVCPHFDILPALIDGLR